MPDAPIRRYFPLGQEEAIGYVPIDKITFTRHEDGLVTADRWPEYIALSRNLMAEPSDVMMVGITFQCANGTAEYLLIGLSDGDTFVAQKIQVDPTQGCLAGRRDYGHVEKMGRDVGGSSTEAGKAKADDA